MRGSRSCTASRGTCCSQQAVAQLIEVGALLSIMGNTWSGNKQCIPVYYLPTYTCDESSLETGGYN